MAMQGAVAHLLRSFSQSLLVTRTDNTRFKIWFGLDTVTKPSFWIFYKINRLINKINKKWQLFEFFLKRYEVAHITPGTGVSLYSTRLIQRKLHLETPVRMTRFHVRRESTLLRIGEGRLSVISNVFENFRPKLTERNRILSVQIRKLHMNFSCSTYQFFTILDIVR